MHIKDTLKAESTASYNFVCIEKQGSKVVDAAFLSMLWTDESNKITFSLTAPDGSKTPDFKAGTGVTNLGNCEVYYSREVSPKGTVMMKIGITNKLGETVGGKWSIKAKTEKVVTLDGYLVDITQSWGNISYWDSGKLSPNTTVTFPATADSVISVAAYVVYRGRKTDKVGDLANYSSLGNNINGKIGVDIAAPSHTTFSSGKNNSYIIFSGTSAAAPHVVGTAALLLQYEPTLTHTQVKNILINSAIRDTYTGTVPNCKWGWGKLNTEGAISFLINKKN